LYQVFTSLVPAVSLCNKNFHRLLLIKMPVFIVNAPTGCVNNLVKYFRLMYSFAGLPNEKYFSANLQTA